MGFIYHKEVTANGIISIEKLNELGAQGWDNYSISGNVFYFKKSVEISAAPNNNSKKTAKKKAK